MQEFDELGQWWLPIAPDEPIVGKLSVSKEDGIKLELYGKFSKGPSSPERFPTIMGSLSKKSEQVTLVDCVLVGHHESWPSGMIRQVLWASTVFLGGHFHTPESLRFHKVIIQYSHLLDWTFQSFNLAPPQRFVESGNQEKYTITYDKPPATRANIEGGTLSISYSLPYQVQYGGMSLGRVARMTIDVEEALSLYEIFARFLSPMQDFLALGTTKANAVSELTVFSDEHIMSLPDSSSAEVPIHVLFLPMFWESQPRDFLFRKEQMLFTLQDIVDDFESIIQRWLKIATELEDVRTVFFGALSAPDVYLPNVFLNVVQALEGYHRSRHRTQHVLSDDLRKRLSHQVLEIVPEEHQVLINSRLSLLDEPSLDHRLRDLLNQTSSVISPLVQDTNRFIKHTKKTRNYLSHLEDSIKGSIHRDSSKLFNVTQVLIYTMQTCWLHELGIPPYRTADLFRRNSRYSMLAEEARFSNFI